jgi:RNA polymerase sigma-70 factor (ECF subfamily)
MGPPSPEDEAFQESDRASSPEEQTALVERIKRGEVELFLKLIEPHERILRAVSHSILQNDADAEEVAQEALLKAFARLDQLRSGQCFRGWLLQIATNEARKRLREQRLYSSFESADAEADALDFSPQNFADWRDIPSLSLERKELWAAITRALRSLDGIYREVFVLRDMQHFTSSQTAMILGVSEACVTTRLHRARLQMREQLAPLFQRPRTGWLPIETVIRGTKKYMRKLMSCDRVVRQLSNYIDKELDPDRRAKIEGHLRLCGTCAVLLDSVRKLLFIVCDSEVFVPPFECTQRWEQFLCTFPGRS